jgi:hypothetical protein
MAFFLCDINDLLSSRKSKVLAAAGGVGRPGWKEVPHHDPPERSENGAMSRKVDQ